MSAYRIYYRSSGKIEFQVRKAAKQAGIASITRVTITSMSFTATQAQLAEMERLLGDLRIDFHIIADGGHRFPRRRSLALSDDSHDDLFSRLWSSSGRQAFDRRASS